MADCIFCSIIEGNIPSDKVYESELFYAFRDIHPQAPVHILVVPKKHWDSLTDFAANPDPAVVAALPGALTEAAEAAGLMPGGFRVISNCGADAGQTVAHLHFHILGGEVLGERLR